MALGTFFHKANPFKLIIKSPFYQKIEITGCPPIFGGDILSAILAKASKNSTKVILKNFSLFSSSIWVIIAVLKAKLTSLSTKFSSKRLACLHKSINSSNDMNFFSPGFTFFSEYLAYTVSKICLCFFNTSSQSSHQYFSSRQGCALY